MQVPDGGFESRDDNPHTREPGWSRSGRKVRRIKK
jgi:hypothetical protein